MGDKSNIEWTDATWNPVVGCSIVSPGCTNCYAMSMANRIERMGPANRDYKDVQQGHYPGAHYEGTTKRVKGNAVWTGKVALAPDHILTAPLRWRKPKRIFVNSMGDLFHESIPDEWIDKVFAVMALCPQHQFQVLTKRAERMRAYMTAHGIGDRVFNQMDTIACRENLSESHPSAAVLDPGKVMLKWPLPNVWLGVSAERQQEADERIPHLLQTPAAIRFVSCEPLLGPIDLNRWLRIAWQCSYCKRHYAGPYKDQCPDCSMSFSWTGSHAFNPPQGQTGSGLDWIIVGGESGPGARNFDLAWARSIRDQCHFASVPCFIKQLGASPFVSDVVLDEDRGIDGLEKRHAVVLKDSKGGDWSEWPADLRVREWPSDAREKAA